MTAVAKLMKSLNAKPTASVRPQRDAQTQPVAEDFSTVLAETSAALQEPAPVAEKPAAPAKPEAPEANAETPEADGAEPIIVNDQAVAAQLEEQIDIEPVETGDAPVVAVKAAPQLLEQAPVPADEANTGRPEAPVEKPTTSQVLKKPVDEQSIEEPAPEEAAATPAPKAAVAPKPPVERSKPAAPMLDSEPEVPKTDAKAAPSDGAVALAGMTEVAAEAAVEVTPMPSKIGEDAPAARPAPLPLDAKAAPVASPRAESAAPAQETPRAVNENTFEQVVLGLRSKIDAKNGKAEIRLEPPNLGVVHVSMQLTNGQLTAEFKSGSSMVRDLLSTNLDKLKSTLESQGVAVDRIAVNPTPSTEKSTGNPQQSTTASQHQQHDGRSAGGFGRDQTQQRRGNAETFQRLWQEQLDLVA